MTDHSARPAAPDVPMSREELQETIASALCCHTRMSPAVQWEIDLLMDAIDKHIALRLKDQADYLPARVRDSNEPEGGWGENPDFKCFIADHDACEAAGCTCSCHRKA